MVKNWNKETKVSSNEGKDEKEKVTYEKGEEEVTYKFP